MYQLDVYHWNYRTVRIRSQFRQNVFSISLLYRTSHLHFIPYCRFICTGAFEPYMARGYVMLQVKRRATWVFAVQMRTNIYIQRDRLSVSRSLEKITRMNSQNALERRHIRCECTLFSSWSITNDLRSQLEPFLYDNRWVDLPFNMTTHGNDFTWEPRYSGIDCRALIPAN